MYHECNKKPVHIEIAAYPPGLSVPLEHAESKEAPHFEANSLLCITLLFPSQTCSVKYIEQQQSSRLTAQALTQKEQLDK